LEFKEARNVAQSTTKAEYITVVAIDQALWIRKILTYLKFNQKDETVINVDN